jgi:hypothetical protein
MNDLVPGALALDAQVEHLVELMSATGVDDHRANLDHLFVHSRRSSAHRRAISWPTQAAVARGIAMPL